MKPAVATIIKPSKGNNNLKESLVGNGKSFNNQRPVNLLQFFEEKKYPSFRYDQLCRAIYTEGITNFAEITTLPQNIRNDLGNHFGQNVLSLKPVSVDTSKQVEKVLFEIDGGERIEAVKMQFKEGNNSLCISSQAGCALACNFCATGMIGFKKNLTADQITDQILYFLQKKDQIHSVAFMGMGEPLLNPNIFTALKFLTHPKLFNMSARRFSISTVGIIPAIERLTREYPQVNLAFSLHTPFPEQRDIIVPANKSYPVHNVLEALDEYANVSNRKIFIAYLVLEGHNDSPDHAKKVAELIHYSRPLKLRHLYHINLLRYNPVRLGDEIRYSKTTPEGMENFKSMLEECGLQNITIRQSFGVDIDAACGQLFAKYEAKKLKL